MTPDAPPTDSAHRQRRSGRTQSADSHSPANSPRELLAAPSSAPPPQPPPAPHLTRGRQRDAMDMHSHAAAEGAFDCIPFVQEDNGHSNNVGTLDLSPRGDVEAEDPPTPRMYKAIIPTAAPKQTQGSPNAPHSPRLRPDTSQVVLHQGHYDQHHDSVARQHASPRRQTRYKGAEQAIEDLRRTVRHALHTTCHESTQSWLLSQRDLACSTAPCLVSTHKYSRIAYCTLHTTSHGFHTTPCNLISITAMRRQSPHGNAKCEYWFWF